QAVAITFTRKAAAELLWRVSQALRASLGDKASQANLGVVWPQYQEAAPQRKDDIERALADLGDAPIGTTDGFIQSLLNEFALDASLPVPGGTVPLDVPIRAGSSPRESVELAARQLLDPPEGNPRPELEELVRFFTLKKALSSLTWRSPYDELSLGSCQEVLRAISVEFASVLARFDMAAICAIEEHTHEGWLQGALKSTNLEGKWAAPAVAKWLNDGSSQGEAPWQLVGWLRSFNKRSKLRNQLWTALKQHHYDFGVVRLSYTTILEALKHPYQERDHILLADRLRDLLEKLRLEAVAKGMGHAVRAGHLGHGELERAAIALCESPPRLLKSRFRALLVDEVQDASPGQLRLYRALAALPDTQSYFVGDSRQSIYLFRGSEPQGFDALARAAGEQQNLLRLNTNHRSSPQLVAAHRSLFSALSVPMTKLGLNPLEEISGLEANPKNAKLALDSTIHDGDEPVWLVVPRRNEATTEINDATLARFLERVQNAWREPNHQGDTAAVLVPTWFEANKACSLLRRLARDDGAAFVEGGKWEERRVTTDLHMHLRALSDRSDDIAWFALFKHPGFGLSDGALAKITKGEGLIRQGSEAPSWAKTLGFLVEVDELDEHHTEVDRFAFANAIGPLRRALGEFERGSIATAIELLARELHWRTLFAAGPGGIDDVAELEVLIDWLRSLAADGLSAQAIIQQLGDPQGADPPRIHLPRQDQHIVCTTVFQAKGLAWDHVAVLSIGRSIRVNSSFDSWEHQNTWVSLGGEQAVRLVGLHIDPSGGLSPYKDPISRLAARILKLRHDEEQVRKAYVAITRARRSVTIGLGGKRLDSIQRLFVDAWGGKRFADINVRHMPLVPIPAASPPSPYWVRGTGNLPERLLEQRRWTEEAPSRVATLFSTQERRELAEHIRTRVVLGAGMTLGQEPIHPPLVPGVTDADWGTVAHGWMAWWRFAGAPDISEIQDYLRSEWQSGSDSIAEWLLAFSQQLETTKSPLWLEATDRSTRLMFERPIIGVGLNNMLLSGRIDLLIQRGQRLTIVDFKAGEHSPTKVSNIETQANLRTYGPQLEAYRECLENAGYKVDKVGLWFLRTGTTVVW
ncbi:MAG: UvrD-helicase domain-containing protein, partial [Proteobacteria bacterium]|nr:UvrD-helicase domain-containing protein [Pseudomonadota bacterium]